MSLIYVALLLDHIAPSLDYVCSVIGLLESFLGLLGCSAICLLLDLLLCLLKCPILIGWEFTCHVLKN